MKNVAFAIEPIKEEVIPVQAKVPGSLKKKVEAQFARDLKNGIKMNWVILVKTAMELYLKERGAK